MKVFNCLLLLCSALCLPAQDGPQDPVGLAETPEVTAINPDIASVYVIPITDVIDTPNLYILRRGLKEAITNGVDMVILDMDTPGGRLDITLDMMEMLSRFEGITATYVNVDAISAGSFIAAATQEIYFAPQGKIGASAVIQGSGEDVGETAKQKIDSYLRAQVRVMTEDYPYRSEVIRAMLDADFELEIDDIVIKPAGELLTLTASEANEEYGDPPARLLGNGIYSSIDALLENRFGAGGYVIRDFEVTYTEQLAKWMNAMAPILMGLGVMLVFIEFKTPGFGVFGISGLAILAVFFASHYIAGLAGSEPIVFFILGALLVLVELFLLPGMMIFALSGIALMMGSLIWVMVDFWPVGEDGTGAPGEFTINAEMFIDPLFQFTLAMGIAFTGILILGRFLHGSWIERRLVLDATSGTNSETAREEREDHLPAPGSKGRALTPLHPVGRVEIAGIHYDARCAFGTIERDDAIRVLNSSDFELLVEADK